MTIKVAINGFGRIGRNILRAHYEDGKKHDLQFVAVNDLGDAHTNAHLLKYDTAHGRFKGTVAVEGDAIVVNGDRLKVLAERDPAKLPWKALGVDVVMECTGLFTGKAKGGASHLAAGAKKVIISAPGDKDVDRTIVMGVNHGDLKASDTVISNASCTTNCLAPLVKALDESHRRGERADDHGARLHQRPGAHRRLPQGPAARALGLAEHDPDQDRRRGRGRPRAAAPERQARRLRDPRADHQRVDRRPHLHREEGHHGRGGQRGREEGFRGRC